MFKILSLFVFGIGIMDANAQETLQQFISSEVSYTQAAATKKISGLVLIDVLLNDRLHVSKSRIREGKGEGLTTQVLESIKRFSNWADLPQVKRNDDFFEVPVQFVHESQFNDFIRDTLIVLDTLSQEKELEDSHPATMKFVERNAEFKGGDQALMRYLSKQIKYPAKAVQNETEGRVIVAFRIDTLGRVQDIHCRKGLGDGCDEEAMRVVTAMPLWEPASQNGKLVACTFELPVLFQLSQRALLKPYQPIVLDTTFIYDALHYKPRFEKGQYHLKSVIRNAIQESLNKIDQNHAGVVKASFCVDVNGQVKNVQVLESSHVDYNEIVVNAIRKLPSFIRVRPTDLEQRFVVVVPFK